MVEETAKGTWDLWPDKYEENLYGAVTQNVREEVISEGVHGVKCCRIWGKPTAFCKKEVAGYPAVSSCWCWVFIPQKGTEHLLQENNVAPALQDLQQSPRRQLSHVSDKCANRGVKCYWSMGEGEPIPTYQKQLMLCEQWWFLVKLWSWRYVSGWFLSPVSGLLLGASSSLL